MRKITSNEFTLGQKVAHVKEVKFEKGHTCHWPGCTVEVKPTHWACPKHWFKLPKHLQARIWHAYQPGQEQTKNPSREYIEVAREVQDWVNAHARST